MASNYEKYGDVIDHTPSGDVSNEDVVVMGDTVGIALADIAAGETGSVGIAGVYEVAKVAGTAVSQGDSVDYDASEDAFTTGLTAATGDVTGCGIAAADAASADTTMLVKLTPGTGSVTA